MSMIHRRSMTAMCALLAGMSASAAASAQAGSVADPSAWPQAKSRGLIDTATERLVDALIARMSLEEKVGQMIQADITSIKPEDLRTYPVGSILAGGSSPPVQGGDDRAPAEEWVKTARAFRAVSVELRPGHVPIPVIFGIDAVHGNSNVRGAVIFPHNIGLGAARDPDLVRRIGAATALETAATGIDWAFGPTLAVPRNDRWGRTYEGYSEDPRIVRDYAGAMVEGLQGAAGTGRIQDGRVAASAKHFLGDGGTTDGIDQGDTQVDEATLAAIHGAGYPPAIKAGAMTVMVSYNSWNGAKMHGNRSLVTDVLKGRLGFDGFVVSDWNGHAQVPGCTKTDCPAAFNAGIDMIMAPDSWKGLYDTTLAQVRSGVIPTARVDDAVRRILRVKARLGLLEAGRPIEGKLETLGSAPHRALAREAVAKSLVLLKNENSVLPVRAGARVLVAGPGADDIGMQSGGWTMSWQGTGNTNADFPNGQSIWSGIETAVRDAGGSATLSVDGAFTAKPDVAIVVFGEQPYAEMRGDIETLEFEAGEKQALALLKRLKAQGIATVSVFLSGRPLWTNPEINASDAFVAAWLPGSEGGGIADVLIAERSGRPKRDFTGRLSFSWPKNAAQAQLNVGEPGYDPLFAYDYGLSNAAPGKVPMLDEAPGTAGAAINTNIYFARGAIPQPWSIQTRDGVSRRAVDSATTQEGAMELTFAAGKEGSVRISGPSLDLRHQAKASAALQVTYRVDRAASRPVTLSMGAGAGGIDAGALFSGASGEWRSAKVRLTCLADAGVDLAQVDTPFTLRANGPFTVLIADVRLVRDPTGAVCPSKR